MHWIGAGAPAWITLSAVAVVGFIAGVQNSLAGGGSFLTFPVLLLTGLDPRAANVTSAVALFPGQLATGFASRSGVVGLPSLSVRALVLISLFGGGAGALLLLATPTDFFNTLVPWLVLFATAVFAWGSFGNRGSSDRRLGTPAAFLAQVAISIYGGYFGGGISILMLAALTMAGLPVRGAWATKNLLAAVMNASAVLIFAFSAAVDWKQVLVLGTGAIIGGQLGAYAFHRVNERILRIGIVLLGVGLTVGLFWRAARS
ncbi:MAG: sulfite exporter TauE/SafE family protein [Steroidobacteraceae bacterium]